MKYSNILAICALFAATEVEAVYINHKLAVGVRFAPPAKGPYASDTD